MRRSEHTPEVYTRAPCVPRSRQREKKHAAGRHCIEKNDPRPEEKILGVQKSAFTCVCTFYALPRFSLPGLRCGARRGPACTLRERRNFGPRLGSVAGALGVQSRESWPSPKGLRSTTPSHAGPREAQYFSFSLCCCCHIALSRSLRCGGHDTAAVAHRALHPVAATDSSASACECVACFLSSYTSIANTWEET